MNKVDWTTPLLLLLGVWLIVHTVAGDLPGRLLSWAEPS